ncbi:MAG: hypothetical protein JST54_13505 [Deltaproteobacteria bacterium]|nr:hypothetical protein [Deltaproteobacteria bacterium]
MVDHSWLDGELEQVIGGQTSDLPAYLSVPRKLALQAAKYFSEERALDPALKWEIP